MQFNDLKNIKRFKEIVTILAKYGFEEIVQRIDLPGIDLVRRTTAADEAGNVHARIRSVLEDLGPTFIKFGQIMSLRPDLLPHEMLVELEKLQDDAPALAMGDIENMVHANLDRPIDEVFSVFDVEPIAAASLSQVHKGVLRDSGRIVSVKVQRPGIKRMIQADLDILDAIAGFMHQQIEELAVYDLPELVHIIRRHILTELDFRTELQNMNIARAHARDTPIRIPEGIERYCTQQVLVMEYVHGARYNEVVRDGSYDLARIAKQGLTAAVKQILEDGFFHADPHPGNLLVTEEMNLCIIDWGMVGRLTEKDRYELTDLLRAVVDKDSQSLTQSLLRLCRTKGGSVDPSSIERELLTLLDTYHAASIQEVNIGQFLMDVMSIIRDHRLQLPTDYVIMIKALVTAEGSARKLYPELNVVAEIGDHVKRLAKSRFQPEALWRHFRSAMGTLWAYQQELPRQIQQIISKLESGDLGLQLNHNKLEELSNSLENAANRLTMAIIAGAIIMGSSMIITTGVGPYLFGFPVLGLIGYLLSVILGLWLVVTIIRSKK
jgi:ubiquinone biosynthesis protein